MLAYTEWMWKVPYHHVRKHQCWAKNTWRYPSSAGTNTAKKVPASRQKFLTLSPQTRLEMSWHLVKNIQICCHEHGSKFPDIMSKVSDYVSTNSARNILTSHWKHMIVTINTARKCPDFSSKVSDSISTNTARNVLTYRQKYPILYPQRWLENVLTSCQKCLILYPQTWLKISWLLIESMWFYIHKHV